MAGNVDTRSMQNYFNEPEDVASLNKRNSILEAEVSRLQAEIINLQQQVAETQILSSLGGICCVQIPENSYQAANVIGKDNSPFMQFVIIDRGSEDGLRRGMPVVTAARSGRTGYRPYFQMPPASSLSLTAHPISMLV